MSKQNPKIVLKDETKLFLDGIKIYNNETYDDIVKRLAISAYSEEMFKQLTNIVKNKKMKNGG